MFCIKRKVSKNEAVLDHLTSAVDRHLLDADPEPNFHFDADPDLDRIGIKTMRIHMRILPQFIQMFENRERKKFTVIRRNASL
jgi:hypothetical protein